MMFLTFETATLIIVFLLVSKLFKSYLSVLFPLKGALFVLPFNKVDDQKVPAGAPKKPVKKEKKGEEPDIDYQLGVVVASYQNFEKHDGMADFEFIAILLTTSSIAFGLKLASVFFMDYFPKTGLFKGFFDDHNIDAYLLAFIIFCYIMLLWKNLFGLESMKRHRSHCFIMAFASIMLGLFTSLGYNGFFVGRPKEAVHSFNVGLTAFISSTFKSDVRSGSGSDFLSLNGFTWVVNGTTCVLVFLCAPAIIKFVDAFQIYRSSVRKYEEGVENISQEPDVIETNQRLLKQFKTGSYIQYLGMAIQTLVIMLHMRSVNEYFFGSNSRIGEISLAGLILVGVIVEAYSTHREVKDRSHHVTEMFIRFKPKRKEEKEWFVSRCHQFYRESLRHMLHALSKSIIPLVLILIIFIFLKKQWTYDNSPTGNVLSLRTIVEPNLHKILIQQYICPVERARTVASTIQNYGVCVGVESVDIHSKNPFTFTGGINMGYYLTEAFLNYFRLVLMNFTICKYLFTLAYIFIVMSTNEEID